MKKLSIPTRDDKTVLKEIGDKAYPESANVKAHIDQIDVAYKNYESMFGNIINLTRTSLPKSVREDLKRLYREIDPLKWQKELRDQGQHKLCAMCGSFSAGTLEHVFPKTPYPEYSIYSKNLVPACKCNSSRGTKSTGGSPGERLLHPYFDDVLSERILSADIDTVGYQPVFSLRILLPDTRPEYPAISFHTDTFVRRNGILDYFEQQWARFVGDCREGGSGVENREPFPGLLLSRYDLVKTGEKCLREVVEFEINRQDHKHESKNNWQSVLLHGCLECEVLGWLESHLP